MARYRGAGKDINILRRGSRYGIDLEALRGHMLAAAGEKSETCFCTIRSFAGRSAWQPAHPIGGQKGKLDFSLRKKRKKKE